MSEWKEIELGNLIEVKYGKDHKKLKDGNIPCFCSGGLMRYVDDYLYNEESILIPRKGSLNNIIFQDSYFCVLILEQPSQIARESKNGPFFHYFAFCPSDIKY